MAPAHQRHRVAQERLAGATRTALAGVLLRVANPDSEQAHAAYSVAATRIVGGAQRRSARAAGAYVATMSPRRDIDRTSQLQRALAGTLVTRESPVATSPMLRLLARLAEGDDDLLARQAAGSYAGALASGDLQAAVRVGLAVAGAAASREIIGWRKELSPDACAWCGETADEQYDSPEEVPFHERDACSVAPIFSDE